MSEQNDMTQVKTLTEFIYTNHKLLTALGIFTALTIFSSNLPLKTIGYLLSFCFFTLTILVWLEVWSKFPSGPSSWRLDFFETILTITIFILICYWFVDFRSIWRETLFILLFFLILYSFSFLVKKFNIFNSLFHTTPGKLKWLRYIFGLVFLLLCFIIAIFISSLISPGINSFLGEIYKELQTPIP